LIYKPNFFVFTGGPGVGKTTLIRHLQRLGEQVVAETHRAVIAEQDRHESGAIAALTAAIDLAQPEGIIRPFLLFGDQVTEQLARYQTLNGPHRGFVTGLD